MMKLDWVSRHEYLRSILLSMSSERTQEALWRFAKRRMSPSDFIAGFHTGAPPPPTNIAIQLKDAPPHHSKRQLSLIVMFNEQRVKLARRA